MKLIIQTQVLENYAAHQWDGESPVPQNWKAKGGNIYVVKGITPGQRAKILLKGIPTIESLINYRDSYSSESVISYEFADDGIELKGETPILLEYLGGQWVANQFVDPYAFGMLAMPEIKTISKGWILGKTKSIKTVFTLTNGDTVSPEEYNERW